MHFFATSAQISNEFGFSHDVVMQTVESLPYPAFVKENIQTFDLGPTKLAQMTEPGYSCVIMHLPLNVGGDDELVLKWRAQFFFNKSPSVQSLMAPQAQIVVTTNKSDASKSSTTNETVRRQAEELISSGGCDSIINEPFASIHRDIREQLGDDPGYQNVRAYAIQRRAVLGVK